MLFAALVAVDTVDGTPAFNDDRRLIRLAPELRRSLSGVIATLGAFKNGTAAGSRPFKLTSDSQHYCRRKLALAKFIPESLRDFGFGYHCGYFDVFDCLIQSFRLLRRFLAKPAILLEQRTSDFIAPMVRFTAAAPCAHVFGSSIGMIW